MKKIKINEIEGSVFEKKGFDHHGCYGCSCNDECCKFGADIDKETYDLIIHNRKVIENELGIDLDKSFDEAESSIKSEYLGGAHYRSIVSEKTGYCIFHMPTGKGCFLFKLAFEKKLSKRIIPSICRVFPLTWKDGLLHIDEWIPDECNCLDKQRVAKPLFETQKKEIDDIFEIINESEKKGDSAENKA